MVGPRRERVSYADFPRDLFREMDSFTSDSTVVIHGKTKEHANIDGAYGSGTLVVIDSIYGIIPVQNRSEKLIDKCPPIGRSWEGQSRNTP